MSEVFRFCLLALCVVASSVRSETAGAAIDRLSWMSGCWTMHRGATTIDEHWSKPAAGNMLGYSRTIRDGRVASHEYMRLERDGDGVRYVAKIGPKDPGTPFALSRSSDGEAEFTNAAHDFPQVIRYTRVSKDEMHARIEDLRKTSGQDFPMKRVACE